MFCQFERYLPYKTYGEDQESIRGLQEELESNNVKNSKKCLVRETSSGMCYATAGASGGCAGPRASRFGVTFRF